MDQPVGGGRAAHILCQFLDRPPLGLGRGKRQGIVERLQAVGFHGRGGRGPGAAFQHPQPHRQGEQLLKDQPPPGLLDLLVAGGVVDGTDRLVEFPQAKPLPHRLGEHLRQGGGTPQRLVHQIGEHLGGEAGGEPVDGRKGAVGARRVDHRGAHRPAQKVPLYPAIEEVGDIIVQLFQGIGVVEKGELHRAAGILHHRLVELHAAPHPGLPQLFGHLGLHRTGPVQGGRVNLIGMGEIHIPPGIVQQQILDGVDPQFGQLGCPLGAHPSQGLYRLFHPLFLPSQWSPLFYPIGWGLSPAGRPKKKNFTFLKKHIDNWWIGCYNRQCSVDDNKNGHAVIH